MNTKLTLTVVIGLIATSGLAAILLQRHGPEASPASNEAAEAVPIAPGPGPMVGSMIPLEDAPAPPAGAGIVSYPDGSSFPALNGVDEPVKLIWTGGRPYSPIVGRMFDGPPNNLDWYVHADGSYSTTAMRQIRLGGPLVATGMVQAPVPTRRLIKPRVSKGSVPKKN